MSVTDWKGLSIIINGVYITHPRFADDIVVMAKFLEELSTMIGSLNRVSWRVGLKMKVDKTNVISNVHVSPIPVLLGGSILEVVTRQIQLGD